MSTVERPARLLDPGMCLTLRPIAYPVFFDLTQRPCVVLGGGPVAERKVAGLLESGATVTVVSPQLTKSLQHWVLTP